MLHGRHSHGMCLLEDEVYVVGGVTAKEYSTGRAERFNIVSKSWQGLPASRYNRINPKLCASFNSKIVYVFGGVPDGKEANKEVEMLITATMDWKKLNV